MPMLDDWNDVKDKEIIELKKKDNEKRSWYQIPKRNVNYYHEFNFELTDWKTDGLIFLSSVVIIPFLISIFLYTLFPNTSDSIKQIVSQFIPVVTALVGFFFTLQRTRNNFWKKGLAFAYLFVIIPVFCVFFVSLLASFVSKESVKDLTTATLLSTIVQIISEVAIFVIFFNKDQDCSSVLKQTFKQNWKLLLLYVFCATIVLGFISEYLLGILFNQLTLVKDNSTNQQALIGPLFSSNKAIVYSYAVLLFISSVLVAPLCEEICTRYSFFGNVGNKWVSLIFCSLYFGYIHCGSSGDFVHLPSYLSAGIILSLVFISCRGNFVYSWMTHTMLNLIILIITFATI